MLCIFLSQVSSPTDTSNFDVDDTDIRLSDAVPPTANSAFTGLHLPFVGFSFTQGRYEHIFLFSDTVYLFCRARKLVGDYSSIFGFLENVIGVDKHIYSLSEFRGSPLGYREL